MTRFADAKHDANFGESSASAPSSSKAVKQPGADFPTHVRLVVVCPPARESTAIGASPSQTDQLTRTRAENEFHAQKNGLIAISPYPN
jgi:hypothetical protein